MAKCEFVSYEQNPKGCDTTHGNVSPIARFEEPQQSSLFQSFMLHSEYSAVLPRGLDIFRKINSHIDELKSPILKAKTQSFLKLFRIKLFNLIGTIMQTKLLPPLLMTKEDDSIFLEWIFTNFRIGFLLDDGEGPSSWFVVTKLNNEEHTISGVFNDENSGDIIMRILIFALENS